MINIMRFVIILPFIGCAFASCFWNQNHGYCETGSKNCTFSDGYSVYVGQRSIYGETIDTVGLGIGSEIILETPLISNGFFSFGYSSQQNPACVTKDQSVFASVGCDALKAFSPTFNIIELGNVSSAQVVTSTHGTCVVVNGACNFPDGYSLTARIAQMFRSEVIILSVYAGWMMLVESITAPNIMGSTSCTLSFGAVCTLGDQYRFTPYSF